MEKLKKILVKGFISGILIAIFVGIGFITYTNSNWTKKYASEMNQFFGENNWKYTGSERKKSSFLKDDDDFYKKWFIDFEDRNGEIQSWSMTDLSYKANRAKHWSASKERMDRKEAFSLELLDTAHGQVDDLIYKEILEPYFTENELDCFNMWLSYYEKPEWDVYENLLDEEWFRVNTVTDKDLLAYKPLNTSIEISMSSDKYHELEKGQQEKIKAAVKAMELHLVELYGTDATFEINAPEILEVEYVNGEKI